MESSTTGIQETKIDAEKHDKSPSKFNAPNAFLVSPYHIESSIGSTIAQQGVQSKSEMAGTLATQKRNAPSAMIPARHKTQAADSKLNHKEPKVRVVARMVASALPSSRSQFKNDRDPTMEFPKEEEKILSIVSSQTSTAAAFAQMNSFVDGDLTISMRELSVWLPIHLPKLSDKHALKLAIKTAKKLHYLQDSEAKSRDSILAKLRTPEKDDKKVDLELEELPSFLENLLAYNRIARLVSSIDPSGELKLTKLEVHLFLTAIKISSSSEIGKGLIEKIRKSGCVVLPELCRISLEYGFLSLDIRDSNNQLAINWDSNIAKPIPKPPPIRRIKSHEEVQSEMHSKILKETRCQDVMSSSVVSYMVNSRLRAIKQRVQHDLRVSESSVSSEASCTPSFANSSRPSSAARMAALWKQGSTPRHTCLSSSASSLINDSSLLSRTQRSFEKGTSFDGRRQNPFYVDTQNGETIYDMPVLSSKEYMQHCPIAQEVFKRIIDQPEMNPLAFTTSRTPRLYGVHTAKPGVVRRNFSCGSQPEMFFHNVDVNIRRQYRPCTAGSLQTNGSLDENRDSKKPVWCFGAVPWNGKSTDLPKYSGDIGYFEPTHFRKRFDSSAWH
jgi:hypothetical protein